MEWGGSVFRAVILFLSKIPIFDKNYQTCKETEKYDSYAWGEEGSGEKLSEITMRRSDLTDRPNRQTSKQLLQTCSKN